MFSRSPFPLLIVLGVCLGSAAAQAQRGQRPRRVSSAPREVTLPFEVVSCSLGCAAGSAGIACAGTEIHLNEELRFTFREPVDPGSLNALSFRVVDVGTGRTPPGVLGLDPRDPSTLVYRPLLAFDSAGNPVAGLEADHAYQLRLPGVAQGDSGPFVTSLGGEPNHTRVACTVVASLDWQDAVPGPPIAKVRVPVVRERDPLTGQVTRVAWVEAEGAVEVFRGGPIEIGFTDWMNPASILNPVTGLSSALRLRFDPDGDLADVSDQTDVPGHYTITLDPLRKQTLVRFVPDGPLPAAGLQRPPGRIVLDLAPTIRDLGDNDLANPGTRSFTTEAR